MSIVFTLSSTLSIPYSPRIESAPLSKVLKVHDGQFIIDIEIINRFLKELRGRQTQVALRQRTIPSHFNA